MTRTALRAGRVVNPTRPQKECIGHRPSTTSLSVFAIMLGLEGRARARMLVVRLETPVAPVMPYKTSKKSKNGEARSETNDFKSKFTFILEDSESTTLRMEESLPNFHEDHICRKRRHFTTPLQLGTH